MLKARAVLTGTGILLTMRCNECGAASETTINSGSHGAGAADSNFPLNAAAGLEGALRGGRGDCEHGGGKSRDDVVVALAANIAQLLRSQP